MNSENNNLIHLYGSKLDSSQRKRLKSLGHSLQPVVMVGQKGVSENLLENVESALLAHELIKVKVHETSFMEDTAKAIHDTNSAQLVQRIGKMLLFYRAHPEKPKLKI